jgi:hypothetical protein
MPITLGCPSCGKRFRARDESAGKRVKCPYCAAAVAVPTAEEAAAQSAASPPPQQPAAPAVTPAPVSAPADWGSGATGAPPDRNPFGGDVTSPPPPPVLVDRRSTRPTPKQTPPPKPVERPRPEPADEQPAAVKGWKKARGGLFWVQFALLWLAIPGCVGFGKLMYTRSAGDLPKGDGWVSIPGYVNDNGPNSVRMTKTDQLDVVLYAAPVLLGGLCLTFGRLTCGAAPRSSGASGLFACSGLFTLLGLASLVTAAACDKLLFHDVYAYTSVGFVILAGLAEFWFLTALSASGAALQSPRSVRAVGMIGFCFALAAAIPTLGWKLYVLEWRPRPLTDEWKMYEQAALMLGWLVMIGVYSRAVRSVRVAIRTQQVAAA